MMVHSLIMKAGFIIHPKKCCFKISFPCLANYSISSFINYRVSPAS